MKINKKNPFHWIYLLNFTLLVLSSIPFRPLLKIFRKKPLVVLYGHKLSGNLLALKRQLDKEHPGFQTVFLTMDPSYYRQNKNNNFLLAQNPIHIFKLATAECIISDHGLHALLFYLKLTNIKFFDVWHGIPFKGFDAEDFRMQQQYEEVWVASPLLADLYVNGFGFELKKVAITGYARTDPLVAPQEKAEHIRQRLGLKHSKGYKLVLFAPTWKQDSRKRSLFPFDILGQTFFEHLTRVCRQHGAILLFRAHLNSKEQLLLSRDEVICLPFSDYPDTEAILQITDVLICDWSSIAFDYLLLNRPTIFLDVEPPFGKGFSLGPEYRFGPVVNNLPDLLARLEYCLTRPTEYWTEFGQRHELLREKIYGGFADGKAAQRCIDRLRRTLSINESSQ